MDLLRRYCGGGGAGRPARSASGFRGERQNDRAVDESGDSDDDADCRGRDADGLQSQCGGDFERGGV
ncbi:hypothetical protein D3C75_1160280 [compost metagenome]